MAKTKDEAKERKYSVNVYLKDSKLSEPLKQVMRELFHGKYKTLSEWEEADKSINQGGVK